MQPPEFPQFDDFICFANTKNDRILKWHTLSNGKKIQCAGYEGFAYDELLKNYEEDESTHRIWHTTRSDQNGSFS